MNIELNDREELLAFRYRLDRQIWGQWFIVLFLPLAIVGKVLRWTLLRASTASQGIGHGMVGQIVNGNTSFRFTFDGGDATSNASYIFSFFNLFNCRTYEEFEIGISILYNLVIFFLMYYFIKKNEGLNRNQFLFMAMFVGVFNVYTFTLAKEPAQLIYFLLFFFPLISQIPIKTKWMLCLGVILLMMLTTRTYYILMFIFAFGFRMWYPELNKRFNGKISLIAISFLVIAGIAYYIFLRVCQVASPADFAELIRVRTRTSSATTDIVSLIPTNLIELFSVNYVITAVRMLFPLELLRFGPMYLIYVTFQCLLSAYVVYGLLHYQVCNPVKQIALCLYWGFFFCSATFEPDFGSWVRHESVSFPILLFIISDNNLGSDCYSSLAISKI
jgi:hypothetical protein